MTSLLVVEDDLPLRQLLTDVLEDEGYQVIAVAHGRAAVQVLATTCPTVILTDIMMPEMDGIALCLWVQGNPTTAALPISVCSAGHMRPGREWCHDAAFLEKPFVITALLDTVAAVLMERP